MEHVVRVIERVCERGVIRHAEILWVLENCLHGIRDVAAILPEHDSAKTGHRNRQRIEEPVAKIERMDANLTDKARRGVPHEAPIKLFLLLRGGRSPTPARLLVPLPTSHCDLTQFSGTHKLVDVHILRVDTILQSGLKYEIGSTLGRESDRARIVYGMCKRGLAIDVFTRLERRQRDLLMLMARGRDQYDAHVFVIKQLAIVVVAFGHRRSVL